MRNDNDDAGEAEDDGIRRAMYMAREYRLVASLTDELQGIIVAPLSGSDAFAETATWCGILFVRAKPSPWFEGAFPFHIMFPPKYPFECPYAVFDEPIESNTMLRGGNVVPFEPEYISFSPTKVSVCVRLLKFIRRMFKREVGEVTEEERHAARRDVERSSIYRMCMNDEYFKRLTDESILAAMIERYNHSGGGNSAVTKKTGAEQGKGAVLPSDGDDKMMMTQRERKGFDQWFAEVFNTRILPFVQRLRAS